MLTHGWPGSIVEFLDGDRAADRSADPRDAFHVVCPSLPGYGFSDRPAAPGWGVERIAAAWAQLMARLGYDRYGAQGGDWGDERQHVHRHARPGARGRHPPDAAARAAGPGDVRRRSPTRERAALDALEHAAERDSGYSSSSPPGPQTIGYGLVDSPAALCAWIVEKFQAWTDCDGHVENALTRDELLDNLMLYWLPGTGASSARLYWESFREVDERSPATVTDTVDVPAGCSIFPKETPAPVAPLGRAPLHRHPPLERARPRRPLRRVRAAGAVHRRAPHVLRARALRNEGGSARL